MDKLLALNPQNLVVFYFVAKEKSLTAAGEQLHLTQPGITYHIRALEKYTKLKLLDIKRQRVVLTPAGEGVYKFAKEIYQQLADMERYTRALRESSLSVGVAGIFLNIVATALDMFEKNNPAVKLTVKSGETFELLTDVLESKLDLAVVLLTDYGNVKLKHLAVGSSRKLICFASPGVILPEEPVDWKELCNYPIVVGSETSAFSKIITNKCLEKGLAAPKFVFAGVPELLKRFVKNGKGLGFMLMEDIEKEVSLGLLRVVQIKEDLHACVDVILRSNVDVSPTITEFVSMVNYVFRS